jgi:hypothetical protein
MVWTFLVEIHRFRSGMKRLRHGELWKGGLSEDFQDAPPEILKEILKRLLKSPKLQRLFVCIR